MWFILIFFFDYRDHIIVPGLMRSAKNMSSPRALCTHLQQCQNFHYSFLVEWHAYTVYSLSWRSIRWSGHEGVEQLLLHRDGCCKNPSTSTLKWDPLSLVWHSKRHLQTLQEQLSCFPAQYFIANLIILNSAAISPAIYLLHDILTSAILTLVLDDVKFLRLNNEWYISQRLFIFSKDSSFSQLTY